VGDAVLRRLGTHLAWSFQGSDVVGRWTEDGFAVGIHGTRGEEASERIAGVLDALAVEGISTTSGDRAHYTFSAGISSAPADGSSLASLERIAETALLRARVDENTVIKSGERPLQLPTDTVDVVVIEDDDAVADVIEHALRLRQYGFVRFADGAEAANALGQGTVRAKVVLLDVGLPSLDGFGVLRVLRSKGVLDETRVIMLTARSSEAEVLRGIGLGATEHIAKPFSIPVLLARLEQTDFGAVA
jgi:PleD family two-component response regulator